MSTGISWFIIIATLGSLVGFFLLLWLNKNISRPGQTTGHNYDGIEEYDNPLPAWWFWAFILTIVFALGYLVYYPGLGNFPGLGHWTETHFPSGHHHADISCCFAFDANTVLGNIRFPSGQKGAQQFNQLHLVDGTAVQLKIHKDMIGDGSRFV